MKRELLLEDLLTTNRYEERPNNAFRYPCSNCNRNRILQKQKRKGNQRGLIHIEMTRNQKILIGIAIAGIAIYLYKKNNDKNTEKPIITTKPMQIS